MRTWPLLALFVAVVAIIAVVDPHQGGRYPSCPWHAITGTWCPGCGGLRAVHDLLHGHLGPAVHENVLAVLLGPALALWWLVLRWRRDRAGAPDGCDPTEAPDSPGRQSRAPIRLVLSGSGTLAIVVLLAAFTLVRNLPIGSGLAP